jgi:hypothetical protein
MLSWPCYEHPHQTLMAASNSMKTSFARLGSPTSLNITSCLEPSHGELCPQNSLISLFESKMTRVSAWIVRNWGHQECRHAPCWKDWKLQKSINQCRHGNFILHFRGNLNKSQKQFGLWNLAVVAISSVKSKTASDGPQACEDDVYQDQLCKYKISLS